ncbi:MAG: 2,3-diphosphoglycerate synthetase, partial [Coriobacteriia bacterium]|nr:2,3-diphosphoglycerate synthetase [Coriobacteriia bacterium]
MSRVVALIDGEHYPPVVRFALDSLREDHEVLAVAFMGGTEKVDLDGATDVYGVPVVFAADAHQALRDVILQYRPDEVVDLSDEPVLSATDRFRLASIALGYGVAYRGADFRFDPPKPALITRTP